MRPVPSPHVRLHPLSRSEFGLLGQWLAEPLVAQWWNHESTAAAVERDFGPVVDGREPAAVLIAELDARPFGLIQHYPIAAYPDYLAELASVCDVPEAAVSVDYLIGLPDLRGRGLGGAMISACLELVWAGRPDATAAVVPVQVDNRRSWRALEHAGFGRVAEGRLTPDNPRHSPDHFIYRHDRPRR